MERMTSLGTAVETASRRSKADPQSHFAVAMEITAAGQRAFFVGPVDSLTMETTLAVYRNGEEM